MPRVIITENAALGLERCRRFLAGKNRLATTKAAQTIEKQFSRLKTEPESGRLVENYSELRELIISFGNAGYVALYHHSVDTDSVYILAFRHQKEVGYNH
ncbi:MAG: type II toxin-antitoxin system RelE/ParE family toxin [Desulfuromonadales bacterium]|nr:type II toxin-antitoxin system RelE/ParE family toxin [Desulfuromonadales bacterium]